MPSSIRTQPGEDRHWRPRSPPTVAADPDEAPGPLSYSPQQTAKGREQNMVMRNGTETMPSATFASKVPRISNPMPKCQCIWF